MTVWSAAELRQFHAGNPRCLSLLHSRYTPELERRLRRWLPEPDDRDDLLQTVWLRAFENRRQFANRAPFEAWLWAICKNACVRWLRCERLRRGAHISGSDDERLRVTHLPDDHAIARGLRENAMHEWVANLIRTLPPRQLSIAVRRMVLGHSPRQVANDLSIAPGTVKATLFQVRRRIFRDVTTVLPGLRLLRKRLI